jgi:hypothetical protein
MIRKQATMEYFMTLNVPEFTKVFSAVDELGNNAAGASTSMCSASLHYEPVISSDFIK